MENIRIWEAWEAGMDNIGNNGTIWEKK